MADTEIEKAKSRIRGLLAKTISNGCTEDEAMSAANKVGDLLDAYNLTMNDVIINSTSCITGCFVINSPNRHPFDKCVMALAAFCDCKVWRTPSKFKKQAKYSFFGFPHDTEYAVFLSEIIFQAIMDEVERFKLTTDYLASYGKRSCSTSFMHGMATRVYYRLEDMKDVRDEQIRKEMQSRKLESNCTDLVLVHKEEKVEEDFRKLGMRLTKAPANTTIGNRNAFYQGHDAGDKVNLNRPIGESKSNRMAIA